MIGTPIETIALHCTDYTKIDETKEHGSFVAF
jgi:hypothetical protein